MDVFLTEHNIVSYRVALLRLGYRHVGSGGFASVYAKDNHALKVCPTSDNDGYLTYLAMLSTISDTNPWKPKIYDVKMFVSPIGGSFFVVCMEKLVKLSNEEEYSFELDFRRKGDKKDIRIAGRKQRGAEEILKAVFKAIDYHNDDITEDNVMKRENGEYVLTDPLC